jgi:uncharacterized protein
LVGASRDFQVFVKPAGAACNLACDYCYYTSKAGLYQKDVPAKMPEQLLETYIVQHIEACAGDEIQFSWHGGEPTLLGPDYFRRITALQKKHRPFGKTITNGIQTNGTLLDDEWGRFLAGEGFAVGISLDGPEDLHDRFRVSRGRGASYKEARRGYEILRKYRVPHDVLCVVHAANAPAADRVYGFFKDMEAQFLTFLPLVERHMGTRTQVGSRSVEPDAFGMFLCTIFDEWKSGDIGKIRIQLFEETFATVRNQEHRLCIFRKTCGDIPVIEHNGDVYSCDHFVDPEHYLGNIETTSLAALLESPMQRSFGRNKYASLPGYCRKCGFLTLCHGGCPKDRLLTTPDGEPGLNYLCAGYRRFFNHCRPFMDLMRGITNNDDDKQAGGAPVGTGKKVGRNDPCPCGSGRKYKKCCLV